MSALPRALGVRADRIPAAVKELPQWVAWRWEWRHDKWTKPPVNVRTGRAASSTDPATWAPFDVALAYARYWSLPGIGFVLTLDAGIVAVDLDKCVHGGATDEWAQAIVRGCASYTECSPSGTGLRILIDGDLGCKGRRKGTIEVYQAERYVTMTGHHWPGTPIDLRTAPRMLDHLVAQLGGLPTDAGYCEFVNNVNLGDAVQPALLARVAQAPIRQVTRSLLDSTGAAHYPTPSEADSAIACALIGAGFSESEAFIILRESTRGSDLPRRKGRHADSYLWRTVRHAAAHATPCVNSYGIAVQQGNGAATLRGLTVGSHYSQIHAKPEYCESVNNVNQGDS